jgi:hypothetical protein
VSRTRTSRIIRLCQADGKDKSGCAGCAGCRGREVQSTTPIPRFHTLIVGSARRQRRHVYHPAITATAFTSPRLRPSAAFPFSVVFRARLYLADWCIAMDPYTGRPDWEPKSHVLADIERMTDEASSLGRRSACFAFLGLCFIVGLLGVGILAWTNPTTTRQFPRNDGSPHAVSRPARPGVTPARKRAPKQRTIKQDTQHR